MSTLTVFLYNEIKNGGADNERNKYHAYLDSEERTILLHSLVELKNQLIQQGRYTDCVDELIVKVINAPVKKLKVLV